MGSAARARAVVPNVAPPELLIANTELGKPGCGLAIAEWIRNFWPRLPALLISAGCATEIPEEICAPTTLLRIPFTLTEMSAAILEVAAPLVGAGMI